MKAVTKWWNDNKGYGFVTIAPEDAPEEYSHLVDAGTLDLFTHFSAIEGDGFKTLREGEIVEVEIATGPKGPQAIKVWRKS